MLSANIYLDIINIIKYNVTTHDIMNPPANRVMLNMLIIKIINTPIIMNASIKDSTNIVNIYTNSNIIARVLIIIVIV